MLEIIIITGLSGAGKSVAVKCFEDLGYFCIDNMPPELLGKMIELSRIGEAGPEKLAIVMDVRGGKFFSKLNDVLSEVEKDGVLFRVLFLEASDEVLIKRYKETKRTHPLSPDKGIQDGIIIERSILGGIKSRADLIIDTSTINIYELREKLKDHFGSASTEETLRTSVTSFGFKHGTPLDVDIVMDVRFLPNPYWIDDLKSLDGLDPRITEFVLENEAASDFFHRWLSLLEFLFPRYIKEGKTFLSIAVGCTGGRHRSVAVAEKTAKHFRDKGYVVTTNHRDIGR